MSTRHACIAALACAASAFGAETAAPAADRLPTTVVRENVVQEETPVGPYHQPEWTTARRFPTTRVYIQQPPWGMAVEQWVRSKFNDEGRGSHQFQEEFEIGLPHRFQVDLYENWSKDATGYTKHDNVAAELRWAPADWGVLPLNPAFYGEYKFVEAGDDVVEAKLLLGEELARDWHWGLNAIWERELGGEKADEMAVNQAISYTLVDRKFSIGAEMKYAEETAVGTRGDPERKFSIGPSLQWRPTETLHIDMVPLFGVTEDATDLETYIVFGWDFGPGNDKARTPVSLKSN